MVKRSLFLAIGLLLIVATAGCFDLLAVPGVAVSPDGTQVYFLAPLSNKREDLPRLTLYSLSIEGGETTAITTPSSRSATTAFAVNPTNGDVAYVETIPDGKTHVLLYSGGSAKELVSGDAFGTIAMGTMMRYSPDGSTLALAMLLLPSDVSLDVLENLNTATPDQLEGTRFRLYLVNAADGTLTPVSDPDTERVNTFDWSPDSKRLVYTTWIDGNGDGTISTMPNIDSATLATDPGDRGQIRIYDLETEKTTAIDSYSMDYAPIFVSNDTIAYTSLNVIDLMTGGEQTITTYDLASGDGQSVYSTTGFITGLSLSPDGSQVAWAENGAAAPATGAAPPDHVFVASAAFQNPRSLADLPSGNGLRDVPIWTPDGQSLLISTSSIFSTIMKQAVANASSAATPSEPKLLRISLADGAITTIYEGVMGNSDIFTAIFSLVTSGAMQQLSTFPSQ